MEKIDSHPVGFFFPHFDDISFNVSPMALHPRFTLKMFEHQTLSEKIAYSKELIADYGWQLFEKLLGIEPYEYHFLMTYHIEHIANKREWLNSFLLLITGNRDLFVERCGIEKYTFLYKMVIDHYSAFNNAFLSPLSNSCEDCRSRIITHINRDVNLLDDLEGPEREYFYLALNMDYRRFAAFWNFNIDSLNLANLKDKSRMIEIDHQFIGHLKEEFANKGFRDLSGLKQIEAYCTTDFCAKKFAGFLACCEDDNGNYVFKFQNTTVAEWIPRIFYFPNAKQNSPSSFRDKLPSKEDYKDLRNKKGKKG